MLPEDVLLEIFDFYRLDATKQSQERPWNWKLLMNVCRKWRHVVSLSPRRLDLHILCEPGRPIENLLDSWPTLPLVVRFDANLITNFLSRNIMVAFRHPDRICEINLRLSSSMAGPIIKMIQKPCRVLEVIRVTVNGTPRPLSVHDAFLGGFAPHLREIELDGIALPFPAIRQVLLSTNNLVELRLSNIPNDGYFSPDDLVTGLSTSLQLKSLTIGLSSPDSRPPPTITRSPPQRTTLPSLRSLEFRGASEYLEDLVARIDSAALSSITIALFNQTFFEIPQLCRFMRRLNALRSPTWVSVIHSAESVNVFFFQEGKPPNGNCFLGTSCRRLGWQLSFVTEILSQLSPLLCSVVTLSFTNGGAHFSLPSGQGDVDPAQWLELFQPFTHTREVRILDMRLIPDILQALATAEDIAMGVLPELTSLSLMGYHDFPFIAKAAEKFVAMRGFSGRMVSLSS